MTTKVRIEIVQEHMPVIVEVLRGDGTIQHTSELASKGNAAEEYVHSGQTLRIREMTTAERHLLEMDDIPSCPHGFMAGPCPACALENLK